MHMWGTEEPGKILPQIFKVGGKCGFRLVIGLISPSFLPLFILNCLNYSPVLSKHIGFAVMQMFLFGWVFLMLSIYFEAKKHTQAKKKIHQSVG